MSCLPIENIPDPITIESIQINGVSMQIIFWTLLVSRLLFLGWKLTVLIIVVEFLLALFIRDRELSRPFETTRRDNIREGDVIIVCRGGRGGEADDWAELFMYHVSTLLYTQSLYGHVGQVFRDYDGELKVADVRYNKKNRNDSKHYVETIDEFIKNYEGTHYVVHRKLSYTESKRLTDAVHLIGKNTGHCVDCFNPIRLVQTPTKYSSTDEILEFGKRYGFGCAENVTMIQRIAGISQIDDWFITPQHFSKNQNVKIIFSG
jgi:hypothetical protein